MESPRARDTGDLLAPEPKAALSADLPFVNDDEVVPDLPSFCGVLSCEECSSFLFGVSSRGVRDRSSRGLLASGLARFCGRTSPSVSARFRFSGVSLLSCVGLDLASGLLDLLQDG